MFNTVGKFVPCTEALKRNILNWLIFFISYVHNKDLQQVIEDNFFLTKEYLNGLLKLWAIQSFEIVTGDMCESAYDDRWSVD